MFKIFYLSFITLFFNVYVFASSKTTQNKFNIQSNARTNVSKETVKSNSSANPQIKSPFTKAVISKYSTKINR